MRSKVRKTVFCKKCHKRAIVVVTTMTELASTCRCNDVVEVKEDSGTMGVIRRLMSSEKRSGFKRQVAKEMGN